MRRFSGLTLLADIPAGVVVFLVALPLCLGVALASGAPLFSGLVAGIVGGTVVAILSGSSLSVSGPAAGLTVIVLGAIQSLGSFETFLLAGFLAGFFQLLLGYVGAGSLSAFIPNAVIRGMLVAIGLILIMKQIPHAVGYGGDLIVDETFSPETPLSLIEEIARSAASLSLGAMLVCLGAILIIVLFDHWSKRGALIARILPGPLLAVLWGLFFERFSEGTPYEIADQHFVALPDHESLAHLFASLKHPDFSQILNPAVLAVALTLAVVASLESLMSLEAVDRLDPEKRKTPQNRELKAQGVGNMVSALLGGLPVTSVIVRSSANVNAGAKSKVSAIVHGILLLVSVLFLVEQLNRIPLSTLSAILLVTGYKLAHPALFMEMLRRGRDQFIPFAVTVTAILVDDLLIGILIGTVVGLGFVVKSNFRSAISLTQREGNFLLRFRKDVTFLNKNSLRLMLEEVLQGGHLLIDGTPAKFIDRDILDSLVDYEEYALANEISVQLRNVLGYSGPLDERFAQHINVKESV